MTTRASRPTSIRIFLADGVPEGLRIIEKSNWTGRAVVVNRAQVDRALKRDELAPPGVYVLTGTSDEGAPQLYVGEADVLRDRIRQHVAGKEFWTRLIAFSSSNEGLNKAHIRYLEARLIGLARAANQWELDNGTQPGPPPMSEPDRADAEWFLAEMLVIFPLLGIDAFEAASRQAHQPVLGQEREPAELILQERGAMARGREVADGFVVLKGSRARAVETNTFPVYMRDIRRQLLDRGVLVADGNHLLFTQDFRFTSPTSAAGVLVGGTANGRLAWSNETGITLQQLRDSQSRPDD